MADFEKDWQRWGETDPYYGVLTDEKFRTRNLNAETKREFFASGEQLIQSAVGNIRRCVEPSFSPRTALDFGCGTGRLLIPLARRCESVTGLDVSEAMLAEAEKNCRVHDVKNVSLVRSDPELSGLSGEFDLITSHIVFQHIPEVLGRKLLARLMDHLSVGGVAVLHFVYARRVSWCKKALTWLRYKLPLIHYVFNCLSARDLFEPRMPVFCYDRDQILQILRDKGVSVVHTDLVTHGDLDAVILYCQKQGRRLDRTTR